MSRRHSSRFRCTYQSVEALEDRRLLAAAGSLDLSFNGTGKAALDFQTTATAVQIDGKTVVVGYEGNDVALARFNIDGTLDTTFGPSHTGKVVADLGGTESYLRAVAIQGDGKIVVAGFQNSDGTLGGSQDALVARYLPNGTLDSSFDSDGKRLIDFGFTKEEAQLHAIIIQSDGKIVVAGTVFSSYSPNNYDFAVARLNTNGSLDGSFDGDGHETIDFGEDETARALAIDGASNIIAVGEKYLPDTGANQFAIARMKSNGSLDSTFDADGRLLMSFPGTKTAFATGVVVESDKIVVSGSVGYADTASGGDLIIARYLNNGALDTSFGSFPKRGFNIANVGSGDRGTSMIRATDGKFVVGGVTGNQGVIAKFADDGLLDGTFGNNGIALAPAPIAAMAAGPGHRFVTTGGTTTARFLDAGANLVYAVSFDPTASEAGRDPASFIVYRSERLPYATNVYLTVSGTATSPLPNGLPIHFLEDYSGVSAPPSNGVVYTNTAYVVIPANETFTTVNITPDDDTKVEGGETAIFTIQSNSNYEVGNPSAVTLTIKDNDGGSISGRLFNDLNGDGAKDLVEPGLAGRTVYVDSNNNGALDSGERSVTTDSLGNYHFGALLPGNYKVREVVPSGWTQTTPSGGAGITAMLALGQAPPLPDFGTKTVAGSFAGTVFDDANDNGVRDSGEGVFANITIYNDANNNKALDAGEQAFATDVSGNYSLGNLPAGTYIIRQKLPSSSYVQTVPSGGFGIHVTLAQGQNVTTANFGDRIVAANQQGGSISGTVFNDVNGNGTKDSGEAGLSGRTVWLDTDLDSVLDSTEIKTSTDASGNYKFSNLAAGTYKIREVLPSGWVQTIPTSNFGNNATLTTGQNVTGKNFGTRQTAATGKISGAVFHDFNRNGIRDTGDSGLSGWTVWIDTDLDSILDANETRTTTDASGSYSFSGLNAGTYKIRVLRPGGWVQTTPANNFGINVTLSTGQQASGKLTGMDN